MRLGGFGCCAGPHRLQHPPQNACLPRSGGAFVESSAAAAKFRLDVITERRKTVSTVGLRIDSCGFLQPCNRGRPDGLATTFEHWWLERLDLGLPCGKLLMMLHRREHRGSLYLQNMALLRQGLFFSATCAVCIAASSSVFLRNSSCGDVRTLESRGR